MSKEEKPILNLEKGVRFVITRTYVMGMTPF